ncbi:DUF4162 domain-containing protein, partial [bacterium]|nr:DUF4162 domain-containing protein [bacterium]
YSKLETLPWIKHINKHDSLITVNLQNAEKRIAEIVHLSVNHGIVINSISIHKPTLEDVFLNFTGRKIREEEADHKDRMRIMRRMRRK